MQRWTGVDGDPDPRLGRANADLGLVDEERLDPPGVADAVGLLAHDPLPDRGVGPLLERLERPGDVLEVQPQRI
jgi:hypothetical protein